MLVLKHASLATVDQLFRYKHDDFELEPFPGYTTDQWGIKAHNRPWIEEAGSFQRGQRVIEVGGAYSLLPKYLADRYGVEAWVGDDFGAATGSSMWSRWGDPGSLPERYPQVRYVFEPFGGFSAEYPDAYFDRVFSVSTLEHIPRPQRLEVLRDMHRCLRPGGLELHTIDVGAKLRRTLLHAVIEPLIPTSLPAGRLASDIHHWLHLFRRSGVRIRTRAPNPLALLDRKTLVESPDVVYRFYPPNDEPKAYIPAASLLLVIERTT